MATVLTTRRKIGFGWLALTAVAIAVFAPLPYLTAPLEEMGDSGLASHYAAKPAWVHAVLYTHMVGSGLALLLCPAQLSAKVRRRWPKFHRVLGRITIVAMLVGGTAGAVLAPMSIAGVNGMAGFGLLAVLSVAFPVLGLRAIRRGDPAAHRRWMVRAFSLVYAGVMLRVGVILLLPVVGDFDSAYAFMPFGSWVPNLLVAEWVLRREQRRPQRREPVPVGAG
ncbi:DUF2306 domain-containing protein [Actinosynnema sp. NPDC047251]|uniref:DUF2306 domain-containing protein n=1 Tax=Saccharothrix espanaensis TaxID=103731 RepID=UPI0002EADCC4|nr:DUF2306 domain-containing protein [Saccharothrix espanaensis]